MQISHFHTTQALTNPNNTKFSHLRIHTIASSSLPIIHHHKQHTHENQTETICKGRAF